MTGFLRYAVYEVPEDEGLAAFGASWLGWDIVAGQACAQPPVDGIGAITKAPRKYGFHGTLKAPFRLADGETMNALDQAVAQIAARRKPVEISCLELSFIGPFLALVPKGDTGTLADLAFDCVRTLDHFRAPPMAGELERRRGKGLSSQQDAMLERWGYPYVSDEFRFHMTLTGPLKRDLRACVRADLEQKMPPLPRPYRIASVALVGEGEDGRFRLIQRHALSG